MAVITLTDSMVLAIERMSWGQERNDVASRSVFGAQTLEVAAPVWLVDLAVARQYDLDAGDWKSLLLRLRGQTNQLELWNIVRPAPLGSMRGSMTLSGAHAKGATTLQVTAGAGQAGGTLKTGDYLGLGSGLTQQVVMATADAMANGSGLISVSVEPPLRTAFAGASAVAWDKPKALFRRASGNASWDYASTLASGFALSLREDWRP